MQWDQFCTTDFSRIDEIRQKSVKLFLETNIYDWPHTFNSLLFVLHLCPKSVIDREYKLPMLMQWEQFRTSNFSRIVGF